MKKIFFLLVIITLMVSACAPAVSAPTDFIKARNTAILHIADAFPDEGLRDGLAWKTSALKMDDQETQPSAYEFTSGDWLIQIQKVTAADSSFNYLLIIDNEKTGFFCQNVQDDEANILKNTCSN